MRAAGDVGKGLVDRDPLDQRREVAENGDRRVAEALVVAEMPADEDELRTQRPRRASRHAAADPEGLGLVGRRQDHAAADGDRLSEKSRIKQLFDGRIEGVEVGVEDRRLRLHGALR